MPLLNLRYPASRPDLKLMVVLIDESQTNSRDPEATPKMGVLNPALRGFQRFPISALDDFKME
jgi:hypothetical protein